MRLFLFSLCIAALLALPYIALCSDMDFPFAGVSMLPVTALHFLANLAHESGHTLARWLFGYPASFTLDTVKGGGYTAYGDRSLWLLWCVWGLFTAALVCCKQKGMERAASFLYGAFIIHIILALDDFHEAVILYLEHGMEIIFACAFVLLAAKRKAWGFFWRVITMASGFYIVIKNMLMCFFLLSGKTVLKGHASVHGGAGAGDFDRIADIAWWGKEATMLSFLALAVASLALTAFLAIKQEARAKKPEKKLRAEARRLLAAERPWKFFLAGFCMTAVAALPYAFHQFESDLPLWALVALLPVSEALHYMNVIVHEPGHALAYWIFGTPAFTLIDAVKGGGVTYNFGRSHALLAGIYVLAAAFGALLARKGDWRGAAWLAAAVVLHVVFLWHGWDLVLAAYMGHGLEVVAGAYLVLLSLNRQARQSLAERYTAMVFGLYLFVHTGLLCLALLAVKARRLTYGMQKGKPGSADIDKAAQYMGVSMEAAAALLGLFLLAVVFATLWILRKRQTSGRR